MNALKKIVIKDEVERKMGEKVGIQEESWVAL